MKSDPWLKAAHANQHHILKNFRGLETNFQLLVEDVRNIKTKTELLEPDSTELGNIEDLRRGLRARLSNIMSHIKLLPRCCATSSRWADISHQAKKLHDDVRDFGLFASTKLRQSNAGDRVANLELSVVFLNNSPCTHTAKPNVGAFPSKATVGADLRHVVASNEPTQQTREVQAHSSPVPMRAVSKITSETPAPYTTLPARVEASSVTAPSALDSPEPQAPNSESKEFLSDGLRDISGRVAKLSDNCTCGAMQGLKKDLLEQCEGCKADLEDPSLTVYKEILDEIESDLIKTEAHECQVPAMATAPETASKIGESDLSSTALNTSEAVATDQGGNTHQSDLCSTAQNTAELPAPDHGAGMSQGDLSSTAQSRAEILMPERGGNTDQSDISNTTQNTTETTAPDQGCKIDCGDLSNTAQNTTEIPTADQARQVEQRNLRYGDKQPVETLGDDQCRKSNNNNLGSMAQVPVATSSGTTDVTMSESQNAESLSVPSLLGTKDVNMTESQRAESLPVTTASGTTDINMTESQHAESLPVNTTSSITDVAMGEFQHAEGLPVRTPSGTTGVDMRTGELEGADSVDTPNLFGITDTAMNTSGLEEAKSVLAPNPARMTDTVMGTGGLEEAESVLSPSPTGMTDTVMDTDPVELPVTRSIPVFHFSGTADTTMETYSGGSHTAGHVTASLMSPSPHFSMSMGTSAHDRLSSISNLQSTNEGSFRKPGSGRYGLKALASKRAHATLPQANLPQAILPSFTVANTIGPTSVVQQSAPAAPISPASTLPAMMIPQQDIQQMRAPKTPISQSIRAEETVSSTAPQTRILNTGSESAVPKTRTTFKRSPTTSGIKPLLPKEPTSKKTYFMAEEIMKAIGLQGGVTNVELGLRLKHKFSLDTAHFRAVRKMVAGFYKDDNVKWYLRKWTDDHGETTIDMDDEVTPEFVRAQIPPGGIHEKDLLQKFYCMTEFIYDPRLFEILWTVAKKDVKERWYKLDEKESPGAAI